MIHQPRNSFVSTIKKSNKGYPVSWPPALDYVLSQCTAVACRMDRVLMSSLIQQLSLYKVSTILLVLYGLLWVIYKSMKNSLCFDIGVRICLT